MVPQKNFPEELIGREIEVISSKNPGDVGIKGKIINETKFTLVIEQKKKSKTLFKRNILFKISPCGKIIEGKQITKKPEERIKTQ